MNNKTNTFRNSLALVLTLFASTSGLAQTSAQNHEIDLTISADIDGRDILVLNGDMYWNHYDFAAVGRHYGKNEPTYITEVVDGVTTLNNYAWVPAWPSDAPDEVRYQATSSTFTGLAPGLPSQDMDVQFTALQARSSLTMLQYPSSTNNYTIMLDFNDDPVGSDAWYTAQLKIFYSTPVVPPPVLSTPSTPEPGATSLIAAIGISGLLVVRRRQLR